MYAWKRLIVYIVITLRVYTLYCTEMDNDSLTPLPKRPRNREILQLPASEFSQNLTTQIAGLRHYLTEPLSATRKTDPLSRITLQATERRLLSTVKSLYIYI